MRNIFLVLLLANLLMLGWVFWVDPEPSTAVKPKGVNELAIFRQAGATATESSVPVAASSQCLFVGPVPDLNVARQLSVSLADRGIKVQLVPREGRVWLGHWVQIQGFAARELAEEARQRLRKAGLLDAYVMEDGPMNIINLGVFREQDRAERVMEAARRAGFKAVMRERVRPAAEYWLVSDRANGHRAALGEIAASFDRILRVETGACPPVAGSVSGSVAPE